MKELENTPETKIINAKTRLDEVTLMRTILAILIVFMHSFTCYNGGWPEPVGFVDVPLYKWMSRFSFAFTLQAFVFISGYLFAFQRITLKRIKKGGGISLIINKLKRLILPSVIFSALYFVLFYEYKGLGNLLYAIINGCGHMWYLPMLFWCFIGGWMLEQVKIGDGWKLAFLLCLNVFWLKWLPLQLSRAISYVFYFYFGFVVYKQSESIKKRLTPDIVAFSWIAFLVLFFLLRPLRDLLKSSVNYNLFEKISTMAIDNLCLLLYAGSGLIAFYLTSVYYTQRHQLKSFTVKIASCCFGIYLIQQFVLQLLYYKTLFPIVVGPYWLPWLGFIITIIVSFIISSLLLKTKTGKFLIG